MRFAIFGSVCAVEDLQASDFRVLDNGRPQKLNVETVATGVAPIDWRLLYNLLGARPPCSIKYASSAP